MRQSPPKVNRALDYLIKLSAFLRSIPLTIIILVALLQGILHLFLLPPWQHYDEPTHFEYAWLIANRGQLPQMGDQDQGMRRDVAVSMIKHNFYWNLAPPDLLSDESDISLGHTELGHPPLYYALVSLPLRLTRHLNMTTQLYVARCVSIVLFLLIVLVAIFLIRDLTSPGHILRWLIPLTVALLPPFASHMSAVNNDVGAVFMLSLFLWGTIRLIREDLSWPRLLWVTSSALLALFTKNTASVAVLMLPVALAIALWVHKKWPWRWFCLGIVAIGGVALVAIVDVGDAAYWYREEFNSNQLSATQASVAAPGKHAITIEVTKADPERRLLNPLLPQDVERIKGSVVTVGGWLWADKEAQVLSPALLLSPQGSTTLIPTGEPIHVTRSPTFFAHTYWIPEKTAVVYYAFWGKNLEPSDEPFQLYLDKGFLVKGELLVEMDSFAYPFVPESAHTHNLLRNPSGEQSWLRLRPWVDRTLERYARRSPTYLFHAMQDVPKNGPFLLGVIAPWLLNDFFSAFAWGHVRLEGALWFKLLLVLLALSAVGCLKWLIQSRFARNNAFLRPALFSLALVASVVLLNALLWPLPFTWAKIQFPSSRYLYVAIIPIALFLAGGWWALWPQAYRRQGTLLWVAFLVLLNMISIMTIYSFYQSLPVG